MKNVRIKSIYWLFPILSVCVVLVDQFTKMLAISNLKNQDAIVLIDGVLELSYLQNYGMAFGMLEGKITFLVLFCLLFLILAMYFFVKIPKTLFYTPILLTEMILVAGAIGNLIDRIFRGYVVDFIYFKIINFPLFNIADICVVGSCILLIFLVLFKYEDKDFDFISLKNKES